MYHSTIYVSFKTFNAVIILYFFVWLFDCLMVICCIVWLFNMYLICYSKSPMRSRTRSVSPGPSRCSEISDPPSIFVEWMNFWESRRAYVLPKESLQWYCDMIVICLFLMQEKNKAQSVLTECLLKIAWSYSSWCCSLYSGYFTSKSCALKL